MIYRKRDSKIFVCFVSYFNIFFSDSMATQPIQLVAAKCPTDELTYTNCAIISEKDIDPTRVR